MAQEEYLVENNPAQPSQETAFAVEDPSLDAAPVPMVIQTAELEVPGHEVDAIIRKRVYAALAMGLAPLPLLDLAGLFAIQVELVHALAKKFEVPFRQDLAKAGLTALLGSFLPVSTFPVLASALKVIPVIGLTTSAVGLSLSGGACTYAVGYVFARHFASGGTFMDFKADKVSRVFKTKYEEGKSMVGSLRKGAKGPDAQA